MENAPSRRLRSCPDDRRTTSLRTNPNHRTEQEAQGAFETARGGTRYPARCHPTRPQQPLDENQQALAARYLALALSMARMMSTRFPKANDEWVSTAMFALVEAAQSYDPARNVRFATFARFRIQGALLNMRRQVAGRSPFHENDNAPRSTMRCKSGSEQIVSEEPPVGAELELQDTVESWIHKLPRPHARVFRHIYLDGLTQEETAARLGCSTPTMSRMHSQGLAWLQHTCALDHLA